MVYIPDIIDYKPFYIQTKTDVVARDTQEWGMVAKINPYPLLPNPKDPYKNERHDQHGDEEWCDKMYYESIVFDVSFYIKAYDNEESSAEDLIRDQVESFFGLIKQGDFKTYDAYNGIGRQKVRYAGYSEESFIRRRNWARAIFRITFKANDPITRMTIRDGKIEEK